MTTGIMKRKEAHLEIAASGQGAFQRTTTLLEEVHLVHQALSELCLDEIDLSVDILGRRLSAPLLIGAMTGGTSEAARINEDLAHVAADLGIGFCLGSQRVMEEPEGSSAGFRLRDDLKGLLLIGNIGLVQARQLGTASVLELAEAAGADAMALHLNPAQELVQAGGDRDFRGCLGALEELVVELPIPVIVKETGCGISMEVGEAIARAGAACIEVAGAGGTSWVRVEAMREGSNRVLGELLSEWGVPTGASLLALRDLPLTLIAGGGLRTALDLAAAMALGAKVCAIAQPVLAAYQTGGAEGARRYLSELIEGLRAVCMLTGSRSAADLAHARRVIGPTLERWKEATRPRAT